MNPAILLARLATAPLAIIPSSERGLRESLQCPLTAHSIVTSEQLATMSAGDVENYRLDRVYQKVGSVAVITMSGVIVKDVPAWALDPYWLCDLNDIEAALKTAAGDSNIKSIVIYADSPGGYVTGVPECAALTFEVAAVKNMVTFSYLNGSACYYITSQAREMAVSPSSITGSIGTYIVLAEYTKMYEEAGVTVTFIREGKYKGMGHPLKELTAEEKSLIEGEIKELNDAFLAAVQRARPDVPRESMEGQTFTGAKAIAAGLADGEASSLDDVVSALLAGGN